MSHVVPEYDEAVFVLAEDTGSVYRNAGLSVVRTRRVAGGLQEHLTVTNCTPRETPVTVTLLVDADFADIFEVKGGSARHERQPPVLRRDVKLGYQRENYSRRTVVELPGARATPRSLEVAATLEAGGSIEIDVSIAMSSGEHAVRARHGRQPNMAQSLHEWLDEAPGLETDWEPLRHIYRRSLIDLAALRFYPDGREGGSVPAGGLPLVHGAVRPGQPVTAIQALSYGPTRASTCAFWPSARARRRGLPRQEPGKILHEIRHGELARPGASRTRPTTARTTRRRCS